MAVPDNKGKTYKNNKGDDPRVVAFKAAYLDSGAPTFCNIRQSALKAGYSQEYAENLSRSIRPAKWWVEFKQDAGVLRAEMLQKAERNLDNTLDSQPENDTQLKVKTDVSKFVAERVGKDHYSSRQELTDKDGRRLFQNKDKDTADIALNDLFVGVSADQSSNKAE